MRQDQPVSPSVPLLGEACPVRTGTGRLCGPGKRRLLSSLMRFGQGGIEVDDRRAAGVLPPSSPSESQGPVWACLSLDRRPLPARLQQRGQVSSLLFHQMSNFAVSSCAAPAVGTPGPGSAGVAGLEPGRRIPAFAELSLGPASDATRGTSSALRSSCWTR